MPSPALWKDYMESGVFNFEEYWKASSITLTETISIKETIIPPSTACVKVQTKTTVVTSIYSKLTIITVTAPDTMPTITVDLQDFPEILPAAGQAIPEGSRLEATTKVAKECVSEQSEKKEIEAGEQHVEEQSHEDNDVVKHDAHPGEKRDDHGHGNEDEHELESDGEGKIDKAKQICLWRSALPYRFLNASE